MKHLIPVVLALLTFTQCNESKSENSLIGNWTMTNVIQDGEDVTSEHNPNNDRFIHFKSDSTFVSESGEYGENSGRWSITGNTLLIDSDEGETDDSYWEISVNNDTMIWNGKGTEWAEGFQLKHVRVKE